MLGRWSWLVFVALLASALPALAVTRTLTWRAPLTNTDGTAASVANYMMYRSSNNGVVFIKQLPLIEGNVLTYTDNDVPTGDICYEVTAWNANGESARSNRVCFSLPTSPPKEPTSLRESVPLGSAVVNPGHSKRK